MPCVRTTHPATTKPASTMTKSSHHNEQLLTRVVIGKRMLTICQEALDRFFYFMADRDRIRRKREAGDPPPWSDDPILRNHKFCNVFRSFDRGTQYVLREVIQKGSQDNREIFFRVMLYKLFNRITTWEVLQESIGSLSAASFDLDTYGAALTAAWKSSPIYTSAYQIPAPKLGYDTTHLNHLQLLQKMMEDDLPSKLLQCRHMKEAYNLIYQYPGMGPFLSYQLLLDLNMSPHINLSENEWAACGPGSRAYLRRIFGSGVSSHEAIEYLFSTQDQHFKRLGISDPPCMVEGYPGVSHVDIEHSLCECSKYERGTKSSRKWTASKETLTNVIPTNLLSGLHVKNFQPSKGSQANSPIIISSDEEETDKNETDDDETDDDEIDDDETEYEVSHITDERLRSRGWEYKVRWTGYGPKDDTWLPEAELHNAPLVLEKWLTRFTGRT